MQTIKSFFTTLSKAIGYLTQNFKGILLALFIIYLILPSSDSVLPANALRIDIKGEIFDIEEILKKIESARKDKHIKGVLFVVNSPGGAVAPSIEISHAIKRLATIKPVVTYAQGTLASGSYYASIWSHKIIANPGSLVGSIGVIFQSYNLETIMKRMGISTQTIKEGTFKEVGTFSRPWNELEKRELRILINDLYRLFVSEVAYARNLNIAHEKSFADAHIFSALRAQSVGLIDEVGTLYSAELALKELSRLDTLIWQEPSLAETFAQRLSSKIATEIETRFLQPSLK